jgi:hypothetical protein
MADGDDGDACVRVLFITLEYAEPFLFSGNGVYSRSFVKNIVSNSHSPRVKVLVLCGRPDSSESPPEHESESVRVLSSPLLTWFRLDRLASWKEFGKETKARHLDAIQNFAPDIALGVDWTCMGVWERYVFLF